MKEYHPIVRREIADLPEHFQETFSPNFLELLAALRLHDFAIQRADEGLPVLKRDQDLWTELSHPSVWVYSPSAPTEKLKTVEAGSPEHKLLINDVIRDNLRQQQRLLSLLDTFYASRQPVTTEARLIVETIDLGESNLRSQGASIRLIQDSNTQKDWLDDSNAEFAAFAEYLVGSVSL